MEIKSDSATNSKSNQLRNLNTVRWGSRNITTQPGEIDNRNVKILKYLYKTSMQGILYPPELEIKDTTESNTSDSYLDLPLSIIRDGQLCTSSNVRISISILQTFRFLVATSNLRSPMAFLSHNSSDTPGLAPLMNVLL